MATTIVSSTMLSKMAQAAGVAYVETLTGFKWIARAALRRPGKRLVFGYEEALGYQVGDAVSDKDGLSAALVAAEIAAAAKAQGISVIGPLGRARLPFRRARDRRSGRSGSRPRRAQAEMAGIVSRLAERSARRARRSCGEPRSWTFRVAPPSCLPTNALVLRLERGARVVLRPSGTEPKLKAYFEVATEPVSPAATRGTSAAGPVELIGSCRERRRRALSVDQGVVCRRRPERRDDPAAGRGRASGSKAAKPGFIRPSIRASRSSKGQKALFMALIVSQLMSLHDQSNVSTSSASSEERLMPLMRRLSVLTVTRKRRRRRSPIGCSAREATAPVCTFEVGHISSGMRRSRT